MFAVRVALTTVLGYVCALLLPPLRRALEGYPLTDWLRGIGPPERSCRIGHAPTGPVHVVVHRGRRFR